MATTAMDVLPRHDRSGPLRLVGAGLAGGVAGGLAAGAGSRLAMYVIRLLNSSHNGELTHAQSEVGRWTIAGTTQLLITGLFFGVLGGFVYLVLRPVFAGGTFARGLAFGLVGFSRFGTVLLDDDYEYVRYVSPSVSLPMFYVLFPIYGLVVAAMADRIAPVPMADRRHPRLLVGARAVVIGLVGVGCLAMWRELQFRF